MHLKACTDMGLTQFEICKEIYTSGLLKKVKLAPTAKLVLIALANHYNPSKKDMFPSQQFLAEQLGINIKSVTRAIQELTKAGLIIYETKKVNRYQFTSMFFNILDVNIKKTYKKEKSYQHGQNGDSSMDNKSMKQIKEKINKKTAFKNNCHSEFISESYKSKRPYENFNHINGVNYKPYKATELIKDDKTPMNDRETALKFIASFNQEDLNNPFIRKQVDRVKKHWGLSYCKN